MARSLVPKIRLTPDFPSNISLGHFKRDDEEAEFAAFDATIGGTLPEFLVYRELVRRKLIPEQDFFFQSAKFGGRNVFGGAVVDFEVPPDLAGRVQGEYWHTRTTAQRAADIIQQGRLESKGFTVIDMLEDEIIVSPKRIVDMFLDYRETSLAERTSS